MTAAPGSPPHPSCSSSSLRSRRALFLLAIFLAATLTGCAAARASPVQPTQAEVKELATIPASTATPTATPTLTSTPTPTPVPTPSATPLRQALRFALPDSSRLPSPPRLPPERILIPRVGIDAKVVRIDTKLDEGGSRVWETAAFAVGHHRGSANPGERGNIIFSGHISSQREGAVFKRLPEVVVGDGIILITAEQDYLYRVSKLAVVEPTHLEAVRPTPDETVTLITCVPDGVYSHRLVVTAKRVQLSKPTPSPGLSPDNGR